MTTADQPSPAEQTLELLPFLRSMDRVHRALQGHDDLEAMLHAAVDVTLDLFGADRAWLAFPGDPAAATWRVPMQSTVVDFPGEIGRAHV